MNNFTVPEVSSLDTNEIKDLFSISKIPEQIRIVQLVGIPVRIELSSDNYVEIKSSEEEFNMKDYSKLFKELLNYFYGTTYLFGFVDNDGCLKIYDAYTNENFLSQLDLFYLEKKYYLPIVNPIAEGNFTFKDAIEILNKKINGEKIQPETIHFLPSVYINDKRTVTVKKDSVFSKVIYGQKKEYQTWNGCYGTTNYNPPAVYTPSKKEEKPEVYKVSTKLERTQVYNETLRNIKAYMKSHEKEISEECKEWWDKYGKGIVYLYAIHTLPATRQIVYDYCLDYYLPIEENSKSITLKWSYLFIDMFEEMYPSETKLKYTVDDYYFFETIFKEEIIEFDKFFVKETNLKDDWRYCQNCYDTIGSLYDDLY